MDGWMDKATVIGWEGVDGFDDRRFSSPTIILCGVPVYHQVRSLVLNAMVKVHGMVCRSCSLLCYVDETKTKDVSGLTQKGMQASAGEENQSNTAAAKQSKASNQDGGGCEAILQIQRRHTHRKEIRSLRTTRAPALRIRVVVVRMMPMMMRVNLVHRTPIRRFLLHRLALAPLLLPALLVLLLLLLLMQELLQIVPIRLGRRRRSDRGSRLQRHRGTITTQRGRRKRQNQRRRHRRRAHHQLPPLRQLSIAMPFTFHRTWGRRRPSVTAATRTTTVLLPQHRRHRAALHHTAIIRGRARGVVMMVGVMPRTLPALTRLSEGTDRDQIPSAEVSDTPRLVVARGWDGVVGAIIGGIAALWIV